MVSPPPSHHPVFNDNKPNKMKVVFDAAEEYNEISLNKTC